MELDFEDSIFGTEREIEITRTETCETCDGTRAEPGTTPVRCTQCNGAGEVRQVRNTFLGQVVNVVTCPQCQGVGETVTTPCHNCNGSGRVRARRHLKVSIPAGVNDGTEIRLRGEGEPGLNGGPAGHLYVVVSVRPHEFFRRRANDLILELHVNVAQAALGHVLMVPTLEPETKSEGEAELDIPPGTQSGTVFRVKGKGVPRLRGDGTHSGRGDLQVVVQVSIPQDLTGEQMELFRELADTLGEAVIPPANERGFMDKVLDWLGGE
jgi:molecular chaperone DnaJ